VGALLSSPRAALARLDARGGGFRDAVLLTVVGVVAFRFQQLFEAVLGLGQPSQGAIGHLVGVWANELNEAVVVVIPCAVLLTLLAGRLRDPAQDLELAAACYTPWFLVRGLARAINAVAGERVLSDVVSYVPAAAAAVAILVQALLVIRARPNRAAAADLRPDPAAPAELSATEPGAAPAIVTPARAGIPLRVLGATLALVAVVSVGLIANAVWAARRIDILKPMPRGQGAPDFQLPRIDGQPGKLGLASLRGKVVLLDFWATWCPPCIEMIPVMEDLHREFGSQGVAFIGVNSDGGQASDDEIRAFLVKHPSPYPMVIDDGSANSAYRIRALPQFVLIGRDGTLLRTFIGFTSRGQLGTALEKALALP
jgi:thiol-disulfide isomerase/thioredoxin